MGAFFSGDPLMSSNLRGLQEVAKVLGLPVTHVYHDPSDEELQATVVSTVQLLMERLDYSALLKDNVPTDCTLCIKVAEQDSSEEARVRHIKVHSQILASTSPFFLKALVGGWRESHEKTVEINLANEAEYQDFERMIKLSYQPSFIVEGGEMLDKGSLLRLMVMADRFEYVCCLQHCANALNIDLGFCDAIMLLDGELPDSLVEQDTVKDLMSRAGDAIAVGLGPLADLFTQGPISYETMDRFSTLLKLADKAKGLSPRTLEYALRSEKLMVTSENEPYWLLRYWIWESGLADAEAQALFGRMIPYLRFHHMSQDFLSMVVMGSKMMQKEPRYMKLIATALQHTGSAARVARRFCKSFPSLPACRVSLKREDVPWRLTCSLDRASCQTLEVGQKAFVGIGLADGFPVVLVLSRDKKFSMHVGIPLGGLTGVTDPASVFLPMKFHLCTGSRDGTLLSGLSRWRLISNECGITAAGSDDGESWTEAMSDESAIWTDGKLVVHVGVRLPCRQDV